MTDNQIRELFDTVPFFVDNPIEVLRSSRFIRSMSHCDSASGNHRACIAKFFLYAHASPFLHGVHLTEVQTDAHMENLFHRRKNLLPPYCAVLPCSQEIACDEGPGWNIAFYKNSLRIENRRRGFSADLQTDEIEEGLLPALFNPFKKRFGPYRNLLN